MMEMNKKRIVIVGGGISGLAAAYYLQKWCGERQMPAEFALIEKGDVLGGKIQTLHRDGFVIERGPDSFLARKFPIIELTKELGLEQELVGTNPQAKKTYILHRGKLHRMPPGLVLGIPTQWMPFVKTGLVSPIGKARAALDLVLPRRNSDQDESLGGFLERRLGSQVLKSIAEPLLAGIYAGDTRELSLRATFPHFHEVEKKYRSLIIGLTKDRQKSTASPQNVVNIPDIARKSMFLTYRKGLSTLVTALQKAIEPMQIVMNKGVLSIKRLETGYALQLEDGGEMQADAVILATPAFAAAKALRDVPAAEQLADIPYVSVANVILAFDQSDVSHAMEMDGSGFIIPRTEGRKITACTWTSSKWLHTAPQGKVLLRCYIGRAGDERSLYLSDQEMVNSVREELKELTGITAKPLFYEVTRWNKSMPQYPVGHLERLHHIRDELAQAMPGVFLAGSGYQGVGIPDCIGQGKKAAEQMMQFMGANDSCQRKMDGSNDSRSS